MSPLLAKRMAIAFAAAGLVSASEAISPPPLPPIAANLAVQQANLAAQQANLATQQAVANANRVECIRSAASNASSAPQAVANCSGKASNSQILVLAFTGLAVLIQVGAIGAIAVTELKDRAKRKAEDRENGRKDSGWAFGR